MNTSLFDLYKIGVGPSSSHTMGPMRAARRFALELREDGLLDRVARVIAELYGSLALTGIGHGTNRAVLLGLAGEQARTIDPDVIESKLEEVRSTGALYLLGSKRVAFREADDLIFHRDILYPEGARTQHPNGLRLTALDERGSALKAAVYFSIGGGFIIADGEEFAGPALSRPLPFPFKSAAELLEMAGGRGMCISDVMLANECALRSADEVRAGILEIWSVMRACMERGMATEGILPGGLKVRRRAAALARRLTAKESSHQKSADRQDALMLDPLAPLDWLTVYAMAVNEENAAGGRVVTAPTNGAAGVVPAVAQYYWRFTEGADEDGLLRYFLTSAAIGVLYKENASISGAEVGCQGEVGVACSMAAGGLAAALGGSNEEVEHAAEIGMEHNLGMTCDPIAGLVQIPCIERNAMGAMKAVQACRMAMNETEGHKVSLDQVIRTMYLTGLDMQSRYKETSLAGLALNIIEC
ncbi:MAG TPA: L-serine ammonia-lyase [Acidisarcina sp.]